jgi:hypothetical protein
MRSRPEEARTILLFHIISSRPSKQPRMVGSTLGVYNFGLIFVSARTNKRHHHHHPQAPRAQSPWDSSLGACIEDIISQCPFLQMTYTVENTHARMAAPPPEDAHTADRPATTSPPQRPPRHVPRTHDNRMSGRQMSCCQQTAPPQSRCSKNVR